MYLNHFGLQEAPFGLTPNTGFYYGLPPHEEALQVLNWALAQGEGFIKVTGEVGTGKTLLCRKLLSEQGSEAHPVRLAWLPNPHLTPAELRTALALELGLSVREGAELDLTDRIHRHLISLHQQGSRVVVLIDEAQALPDETLEAIRLFGNLETESNKLLQIVLFGQPELDELLALPKLRQVRDRVVHRFELQPLNGPDAAAYIEHRLRRAGWQGGALFEPRAMKQLTDASGGRIRALHLLADKALLAAFAQGSRQIGREHVRLAVAEFQGAGMKRAGAMNNARHHPSFWLALGALATLGLGVGGAVGYGLGQRTATAAERAIAAPTSAPTFATLSATASHPVPSALRADPDRVPVTSDLQRRYEAVSPDLRDTLLRTRAVFDDPAQNFWVVQVALADNAAGARRLAQQIKDAGVEVWLQDRVYLAKSTGIAVNVWAVYAGRYTDSSSAMQSLQEWPASLKTYKPLPRSLVRLRTEAYPERMPS